MRCLSCGNEEALPRRNIGIACHRAKNAEANRRYRRAHPVHWRGVKRQSYQRHPETTIATSRRWAEANKERMRPSVNAAQRVRYAIRTGKLVRPQECSRCHAGGVKIEAAHHDYSRPLDVVWLCVPCHRQWDATAPKTLSS